MEQECTEVQKNRFWCPECEMDLTEEQVDCSIDHIRGFDPDIEGGWTFVDYCIECLIEVEDCDD